MLLSTKPRRRLRRGEHTLPSTAHGVEQASYQKAERRSPEANRYHLYAALTPISDQGLCRINSDGEERHSAERYRRNNSRSPCDEHERNNWYQVTDESRHCDNYCAPQQAPLGNRLKMQFFIHHRTHPGFTIGRDGGNNIFKKLSLESLSRIDLSDFLALLIRLRLDLKFARGSSWRDRSRGPNRKRCRPRRPLRSTL